MGILIGIAVGGAFATLTYGLLCGVNVTKQEKIISTLSKQNAALSAANEELKKQYSMSLWNNVALTEEIDSLRRDSDAAVQDL